jgi:hypothetical protein
MLNRRNFLVQSASCLLLKKMPGIKAKKSAPVKMVRPGVYLAEIDYCVFPLQPLPVDSEVITFLDELDQRLTASLMLPSSMFEPNDDAQKIADDALLKKRYAEAVDRFRKGDKKDG